MLQTWIEHEIKIKEKISVQLWISDIVMFFNSCSKIAYHFCKLICFSDLESYFCNATNQKMAIMKNSFLNLLYENIL
jgi:hypothetical protein